MHRLQRRIRVSALALVSVGVTGALIGSFIGGLSALPTAQSDLSDAASLTGSQQVPAASEPIAAYPLRAAYDEGGQPAGRRTVAKQGAHARKAAARHRARKQQADAQLFAASSTGSNDIPTVALEAYHRAADEENRLDPACHLPWTLVAAIGRVESDHGRIDGSQLDTDGIARPPIIGPALNGQGAFAAVPSTDNGRYDHDKVWAHAVGPMQFLPSTWAEVGRDGDGDGIKNPNDIFDAADATAGYLCGAGDLSTRAGMARAAFRYNPSQYYVQLVLAFQHGYESGVFAIPSPPPPTRTTLGKHRSHPKRDASKKQSAVHAKHGRKPHPVAPRPKPKPKPTPTPSPSPTPSPTPGPTLSTVHGTWQSCGNGYCLGTTTLNLGPPSIAGHQAHGDYDGNGTVGTNAAEFAGLVGQQVSLAVTTAPSSSGTDVVYVIGTITFRNADGTFP